ncbi:hypothetical protein CK203_115097 [Vitis vinifera]|uniref:Uncharacterized protein n=1 Tax=Vitis vinifera TaxID=29760 RepID=A0A438C8K6_VITVI|nr:hypothetical protein CK203_115097 [Vitis vinifera]
MTFVLLFSHRDLSFNKLNGEIPNLDGLTNVQVYSLAPSYMGYGGGHKSGALRDCITWGKGFQYLWGLPLCLTGNRLNGNILQMESREGRAARMFFIQHLELILLRFDVHLLLSITFVFIYPTIHSEIDLSYSNFSEQSALPSCRDSLQELFLSKLNLVKL